MVLKLLAEKVDIYLEKPRQSWVPMLVKNVIGVVGVEGNSYIGKQMVRGRREEHNFYMT